MFGRQELWNGNREEFRHFFSRKSIMLWAWSTYRRRREETPRLLRRPEYSHLKVNHLRSPHETERWLAAIPQTTT